jgi:diguanylate cyclase (GGDEF)-like protein
MVKRVSDAAALGILLCVFTLGNVGWMLHTYAEFFALHSPMLAAQRAQRALQDIREQLLDAETAQHDYLLSGNAALLKPYNEAVANVRIAADALDQQIDGVPQERQHLADLHRAIGQEFTELASTIADFSGEPHAQMPADAVAGKRQIDTTRALLDEMVRSEGMFLQDRLVEQARTLDRWRLLFLLARLTNLALLFAFLMLLWRKRREHAQAEQQARDQSEGLVIALTEAARRNKQIFELTELSQYLQSSSGLAEATTLLCTYLPAILEANDGAVYLMGDAKNQLSLAGSWGDANYRPLALPDECWALRHGHMHCQPGAHGPRSCRHLDERHLMPGAVCIPLATQAEQLGLLFMYRGAAAQETDLNDRYLRAAVEQVSLAIGNLKLRETLRQQSIRDALTGLYNRRFLEESLPREVARFERQRVDDPGASLAVLMLDVDHFKRFNDCFGHETGDRVLKEVGRVLRDGVRASDLVARFGGEEFSVVLPDIDQAGAVALAEQLRHAVQSVSLSTGEVEAGGISISIGLTVLTTPGIRPVDLLRAADRALYDAKHRGRNQVRVAERFADVWEVRGIGHLADAGATATADKIRSEAAPPGHEAIV